VQKPEWPNFLYFGPKDKALPFAQMNPQSADAHSPPGHLLYQPGIYQAAQEERRKPNQMLPTEKSADEQFEMYGSPGRGLEINSGDFVVRVQGQAHRHLTILVMQPERSPPGVAVGGWAVELFDFAAIRGEPSVKIRCFLRWKRLAHVRVVELLQAGVITCVEQINDLSSDDGVAIGFLDAYALRDRGRGQLVRLPPFVVYGQAEHPKKPKPNNPGYAEDGDLPKGDLEFGRLNVACGGHRENYRAQMRNVRFIQGFAGFGGMKQRFQLSFDGKKLVCARALSASTDGEWAADTKPLHATADV
jgi:hypothetical protein